MQGLVVDHIIEGNNLNFSVENLQFLTLVQNTLKSRSTARNVPNSGTWLGPAPEGKGNQNVDYSLCEPRYCKSRNGYIKRKRKDGLELCCNHYTTLDEAKKASVLLATKHCWGRCWGRW